MVIWIDDSDIINNSLNISGYFIEEGIYELILYAEDSSGNVSSLTININVYESLGSMLVGIDYNGYNGYYNSLNSLNDDVAIIEELAYILRDTLEYKKYEEARFIYTYYDNGKQVVLYDYESRDNSYKLIKPTWGDGGRFDLDNGTNVKIEREHVWAASDMLIKPKNESKSNVSYLGYDLNLDKEWDYRPSNTNRGHYTDLHNLWHSIGSANGTHSNNFYGQELGHKDEYYLANGSFYPGYEYIGDIARILFYMTLTYPYLTLVNQNSEFADVLNNIYYGYLDVLLYWNEIDPPSYYEIERNETIAGIQGNRNPFIDFYDDGIADRIFYYGDPEVKDIF